MSELSLTEISKIIVEERRNWLNKYALESKLREEVHKRLDDQFNKLIIQVLNVNEAIKNQYYGPPVAKLIKDTITKAIDQWDKHKNNESPSISQEDLDEVEKLYKKSYFEALKVHAKTLAEQNAKAHIEQLIEELIIRDNT